MPCQDGFDGLLDEKNELGKAKVFHRKKIHL
jgi:hypothetical protein